MFGYLESLTMRSSVPAGRVAHFWPSIARFSAVCTAETREKEVTTASAQQLACGTDIAVVQFLIFRPVDAYAVRLVLILAVVMSRFLLTSDPPSWCCRIVRWFCFPLFRVRLFARMCALARVRAILFFSTGAEG